MLYKFINNTEFEYPWVLWCLALLPVLFFFVWRNRNKRESKLPVPVSRSWATSWKTLFRNWPVVLRFLALAAIITALARPRSYNNLEIINSDGIDLVLCLDISGSMNEDDLSPTRLDAAKEVAASFVRKRKGDRIGLVVFAAESFTPCPATTHYDFLLQSIYSLHTKMLLDGTHIGEGLASSVSGLEKSKAPSRVIILLTDGMNDPNEQDVSPADATELAKSFGIKVYTVGVGKQGEIEVRRKDRAGNIVKVKMTNAIDEPLLKTIAAETGGKYFRATDNNGLQTVYDEIDRLEKIPIESTQFRKYTERFYPLVWIALGLLFLEIILRYTVLRKFP